MGRSWKRVKQDTAPVLYPTIIFQMGKAAFGIEKALWKKPECRF